MASCCRFLLVKAAASTARMFHSGWQLLHQPGGEAARGAACTPPQQGRGAAVAFDTSECVQRAVSSLPALHFGALAHVARSRQAAGRSQPQSSAVALRGACLEGEARSLLSGPGDDSGPHHRILCKPTARITESCANPRREASRRGSSPSPPLQSESPLSWSRGGLGARPPSPNGTEVLQGRFHRVRLPQPPSARV